ncbi:MAG TPA: FtsX-like permease family protein [Tepidisphaeraceae bacterium]|nr:FtsX-like permease family protein [Tepidisphaeraceae bacterium]
MTAKASGQVQRQRSLPFSKAIEIAYKSIRLRLSRSLLVTSGIVLALAFLMSILAGEAMIKGMRGWIEAAPTSAEFESLRARRAQIDASREPLTAALIAAVARDPAAATATVPGEAVTSNFNSVEVFGGELPDIAKEVGSPLPAGAQELKVAFDHDPKLVDTMKQWIATGRDLQAVRAEITGPQQLEAMLKGAGVPTTPAEIANSKIQTRWLIGLALMVAFAGILNAMLMSVTERFREIGTMKCLGALDSFIIKLFLIESLFQGLVGTIIGVIGGLLLSLVSVWSTYGGFAWKNMQWNELMIGIAVCTAVGIGLTVAGALYPAWQAARMQPIEAMRSDV